MTERQIKMTIYRIETDLLDVTTPDGEGYVPGNVHVYAQGAGEKHSWHIRSDQRCWVGDAVTVTVLENDPKFTPPPIDKRGEG